ncbi:MAG: Asp-tRNA(Asn)/Glu-tRNA(Gln) amidotransferase subunit GatA [Bacteroidia bacterium]|nr:Asp-tRNA(Asn)/Glu-tRNA(Gln) amidotransferase subunit GatA [Bacteroidia bacterium]
MKNFSSYQEINTLLHSGNLTVTDLVNYYLKRIENNKNLNTFIEVYADEALQKASKIDERIKQNTAGKLAGMVIGIKDNIVYKGHKSSASSKILENFESLFSATVVERLIAEDAIIIGRLNCDEFAMGSSNEHSVYGKTLNPLDKNRVPGGSSGASAAAVAADLCQAALGTDTGGSIRQPASFCGVVGFKPSYGRVSRWGAIAYASSFDQIGPITKSLDDCALLMQVMAGKDEYDSTAIQQPAPSYIDSLKKENQPTLRIAYLSETIQNSGLNSEIKQSFEKLIANLKSKGHIVEAVEFPYLDYVVPTYYVLTTAEASSNLSRYDGIHYGYRSKDATDLESTYKLSRSQGFGKEVKRRIMLGTFVLSSGYYDAYYAKAQKVRRLITDKTNQILNNYDCIITPTTPSVAFEFGKNSKNPIQMYLEDIYTVQANLAGCCALSVPFEKDSQNLPFGLQLMVSPKKEQNALAFARQITE